jgi:hypothetical protein
MGLAFAGAPYDCRLRFTLHISERSAPPTPVCDPRSLSQAARARRILGKGFEEEGEHAVAGDVGERGEFEGIVAAGEFEDAGVGAVAAEGVEHLAGEFGEHGGVIFSVEHECLATGAHTAFDVGHGADGGPVFTQLVNGDMVSKTFPNVIGGHALADDVGVVGGHVEKAAGANAVVVDKSDIPDGGTDAGAEDAKFGVTLLFEPVKAAAGVLDGLAVGLEGKADVGAADLIGAFVAVGHAAVVVGHAELEDGYAHSLNPMAEAVLAVPFGVPVGEEEDGGALLLSPEELGVDGVVLGPGRFNGAGEGEHVVSIEAIVGGRSCGVPIFAVFDGVLRVLTDEGAGIGVVGGAADVLEAPVEGLDAAIVVGGPAAVFVAADFAFEPIHKSRQFTVYSQQWGRKRLGRFRRGKKGLNTEFTESTEDSEEHKG